MVALLGAAWALSGELAGQQARGLPEWVRFLPGALGSGLLAMAGFSAVALAIGVIAGWDKISRLITALELDGVGAFLVGVLHLLYLPNFLVWSASFLSGAGFSVGLGSVVAPMGTSTGILPAIPILGALPAPGPGGPAAFLWLIAGLLMGSVAGARMVRRLPQPPTLLVSLGLGALAGVLTGVALLAVAVLTRGDLGVLRLVGLGPRLPELSWLAPSLGLLGGLIGAAAARLVAPSRLIPAESVPPVDPDATEPLPFSEQTTVRI
ncbi:MAG: hypothetical protein IPL43_14030 [Micropruina sp.]|nr:hypothetical protein [Micropruina sp.]